LPGDRATGRYVGVGPWPVEQPKVEVVRDKLAFEGLRESWETLLELSVKPDVLHSHEWYSSWCRWFLPDNGMVVAAVRNGTDLSMVLPLMMSTYRTKWFAFDVVRSMTNRHSPFFDVITRDPTPGQLRSILDAVFETTGRRMIVLEKIPQSAVILRLLPEACAGHLYIARPVDEDWVIDMECSFDSFLNGINPKFRKNIRAAERKMRENRCVPVQPEGTDALLRSLDLALPVEARGWKGRSGSAVIQDEAATGFFKDMVVRLNERGWVRMMLMANNGDAISFLLSLGGFGRIHALKIGMDERFRSLGPGMVVTKHMLERTFGEKTFATWSFGQGSERWKRDWANRHEKLYRVFIFRGDAIGKGLYAATRYYDKKHPAPGTLS
jgi:CelD/BcsL family acetyltransferase involved in cellulose biosynthesis